MLPGPQAVLLGNQGAPAFRKLERPNDATAIVRVHGRRGSRVELLQASVRQSGARVVGLLQSHAEARFDRGRHFEIDQRRSEVEAGSAGNDRGSRGLHELVHSCVSQCSVLAHRHLGVEIPDGDQPGRRRRLVGEYGEPAVDLQSVRRHDFGPESTGERVGDS